MTEELKKQLILSNLEFANRVALSKKRFLSHIHYEDLQSAAYFGLVQAANKYDFKKNDCFQALAFCRIKGAVQDYLREINWGSRRNPIHMESLQNLI